MFLHSLNSHIKALATDDESRFATLVDVPSDFTSFWSVTVEPGKTTRVTVPEGMDCTVTGGSVNVSKIPASEIPAGKVTLFVKANGGTEVAIFPFIVGKFESANTDLMFGEGNTFELRTEGVAVPVELKGYLNGGFSVQEETVAN